MPDSREPNSAISEKRPSVIALRTSWSDRHILPYLTDSTLWPVLIVVIAHIAAFMAPLILLSLRDRDLLATGGLAVLLVLSFQSLGGEWRRRRFGPICGLILVTWVLSACTAYFADRWQLL
jgi:hypothetical protein